ncbi:MAG: hypothetical protein G3M70_07330 [Candidatus Nitronauta litoralis]|uniref:Uncharacterized protein n=1 Tax=Candidatus Nitronauta litoralis TaxID=2705533 RepID=A0A7T0BVR2_9BACT|nr:MAG: hypothetical protein G3M70_07330 [Candidatus Nitronauta litoralis]
MITNVGLDHIADQMSAKAAAAMSHMAIGVGTTAAAAGDTALENESARVAFDSKTRTGARVDYIATFGAGVGTGAITEAGVLNAGASGDLLTRHVFPVKNKGANDTLIIEVQNTYQRV